MLCVIPNFGRQCTQAAEHVQIEKFGSNMAPLGRAGMPAEYGPAAVFLADNGQSSFVSARSMLCCLPALWMDCGPRMQHW